MQPETIALILLAIGTGISVGWLIRSYHGKLNPEGITRLAESLSIQNQAVRDDAKLQIKAAEERCAEYRNAVYQDAMFWREHANALSMQVNAGAPPAKPPPVRPPPARPPTTNGTNGHLPADQRKLADLLIAKGADPETAAAVARGDMDGAGDDPVIDQLTADIARDDSGAV